jgi:hypothetical protein
VGAAALACPGSFINSLLSLGQRGVVQLQPGTRREAVVAAACAFAGTASAALVPGVFDPDHTGCPVATVQNGWLHLEKNCATTTNASAGANITGLTGQTFTSASFTLKSTSVPGRLASVQHRDDDRHVLPRLQQRDAGGERRRYRDLLVHGRARLPVRGDRHHHLGGGADRRAGSPGLRRGSSFSAQPEKPSLR